MKNRNSFSPPDSPSIPPRAKSPITGTKFAQSGPIKPHKISTNLKSLGRGNTQLAPNIPSPGELSPKSQNKLLDDLDRSDSDDASSQRSSSRRSKRRGGKERVNTGDSSRSPPLDSRRASQPMSQFSEPGNTHNAKIVKVSYIVDPVAGPFYKIQDAINHAKSGTIVKISTGFYKENLRIRNKSISIEAKDVNSEVYILGAKGPTILIDNPHRNVVTLQGLRLAHKGTSTKRFQRTKNQMNDIIKDNKINIMYSIENYHIQFERIDFSEKSDMVILLKSGQMMMKKCYINMNLLTRECQLITPAIILERGTTTQIESCELKGSQYFNTMGIVMRAANMLMKDASITNFKSGGIMMYVKENNLVKIFKSIIRGNSYFGIQVMGCSKSPTIQYCDIEDNRCPGIQICTSNKGSFRKNNISLNKNGIEVISSDPRIEDNIIERNYQNGILVKAMESLIAYPKIYDNKISSNTKNGVLCLGLKCTARIKKNVIHSNKMAGITIERNAVAVIIDNDIYRNIFQGILLVENSSAHVERNEVHENIKANIAFGGEESWNTSIINNKIYKGRCEGIFMIDCGRADVLRNHIYENYDGILTITSIPRINGNIIEKNKNHGIMCIKDSRPKIVKNKLYSNLGAGAFIRDKSLAYIFDNDFDGNACAIVQENRVRYNYLREKIKQQEQTLDVKKADKGAQPAPGAYDTNSEDSYQKLSKDIDQLRKDLEIWEMGRLRSDNKISDELRVPYQTKCVLI